MKRHVEGSSQGAVACCGTCELARAGQTRPAAAVGSLAPSRSVGSSRLRCVCTCVRGLKYLLVIALASVCHAVQQGKGGVRKQ